MKRIACPVNEKGVRKKSSSDEKGRNVPGKACVRTW